MKDRKAKSAVKVAHRNDHTHIKRVLGESRQALLPMLELIEATPSQRRRAGA